MYNYIINGFKSSSNVDVLKTVSESVVSPVEAREIIDGLKPFIDNDHSVGLAAIQIGINKRIGVIKKNEGFLCLINPEVVEKEEEFVYFNEGCLSFPDKFYNTKRYKHYTIKNHRIENDKFEEEELYFFYPTDRHDESFGRGDKILAIAVQHEMDHFDGKIITEYAVKNIPLTRSSPKVGRNDLCPCGSGKKYKKCCLGKDL